MYFANPYFLFGLVAVGIPVIVHLFKFRRYKKEYFSFTGFLNQAVIEHKKQSRLRELLIMACRMLAIACIVFAFAQPHIGSNRNVSANSGSFSASVYLDNSYSMEYSGKDETLLEQAKGYIKQILSSFPEDAALQLLTNSFTGNMQALRPKKEILQILQDAGAVSIPRSFEEIAVRQADLKCNVCFYISDFQRSTFKLPQDEAAMNVFSNVKRVFIPLIPVANENISIDSVWTDTPLLMPGKDIIVKALITNHGKQTKDKISLRMFIDGKQSSVTAVDLPAGKSIEATLSARFAESGFKQGYLEISDYPVQYDNRLYFTLPVSSNLGVLHIYDGNGGNPGVTKIFGNDSSFKYISVSVTKIDYSLIPSMRLIIIDEVPQMPNVLSVALKQAMEKGTNVVLIPPADAKENNAPYSNILSSLIGAQLGTHKSEEAKVTRINFDNPVFKMALAGSSDESTLPTVKGRYALPVNVSVPSEALMSFNSDEDFMRVYEAGSGLLYLISSPISKEYTNFTSEYSFVVSFLNMALYSHASADLYSTVGSAGGVRLTETVNVSGGSPFNLISSDGDFFAVPQVRNINNEMLLFTNGIDVPAGNYLLRNNNITVSGLSFNDSRKEGVQEYYSASELEKFGSVLEPSKVSVSNALYYAYGGRALWKWFVIAVLVALAVETLLLRLDDIKRIFNLP
ncbi:MAG: BatA domain-containing protein [Bacteroidales bacterium]|jgi:hypothetical protein|nr:BatA domain-containing protein [Bacteroidales bacterium]